MNKIQITGAMRSYLRLPIYMLIPIAIVAIGMSIYDNKLIWPSVVLVSIYGIVAVVAYIILRRRCVNSLVDLAVNIETSQKAFLLNMPLPYAMITKDGTVLWHNISFGNLTGIGEMEMRANILELFGDIKKEYLKKLGKDPLNIRIGHETYVFTAHFEQICDYEVDGDINIYTLMLFDETRAVKLEAKLDEDKLVVGNVFIDNYEETLEEDDDVKNSLLAAVIERKIRKYFGEADAIVRKIEKDKYFLIFPKKYLNKLIENKFSILEEIKNTKVGKETPITLSIGIGLNGDSFSKDAEFAKAATDLALGRGGSQVVVKDAGEVSIYGIKGKEVSKNTRVKARVKAQALRGMMTNRDRVIIMGHSISDFDCLGAAIGIMVAARHMQKPCHIVLGTVTRALRPMLETFTGDDSYPEDMFISAEKAVELVDDGTLIVVVDTNRPTYTECPEILTKTSDIVVFDHHRQGVEKIENPILSYLEPYASSTCEMVAEILQYFSEDIEITPKEADCLYAGMLIDTNNFMTKTGVRTFEAAAYLRRSGAEVTRVRKLLREDINAYKARAEIVRNAVVYKDSFAISVCNTPELESPTVVGAQAANELLNIVGIKASFVLTEYQGKIYVSSRSIDEIDVQHIMEQLGGGGHLNVAGAQIDDAGIPEVEERIREQIDIMINEGMIK